MNIFVDSSHFWFLRDKYLYPNRTKCSIAGIFTRFISSMKRRRSKRSSLDVSGFPTIVAISVYSRSSCAQTSTSLRSDSGFCAGGARPEPKKIRQRLRKDHCGEIRIGKTVYVSTT